MRRRGQGDNGRLKQGTSEEARTNETRTRGKHRISEVLEGSGGGGGRRGGGGIGVGGGGGGGGGGTDSG